MVTNNYLFTMMIVIYALSLLFYFSDFARANRSAKRIGTGLLIFVWVMQTVFLLLGLGQYDDWSLATRFDYMFFFTWLLLTLSLAASRFVRFELPVFFINVIAFAMLAVIFVGNKGQETPLAPWEMAQELLSIHIGLVLCAYAAFTFSAIFSSMYLFLHGQLKEKNWSQTMRRLPSLASVEQYTLRAIIIGTPLLILSLSVALASLLVEGRSALLLDWKVFSSFTALAFYVSYIVKRTVLNHAGPQLARWSLLAFAVLLINMFLNSVSRFHSWS